MANPSNADGQLTEGQTDSCSSEPLGARNLKSASVSISLLRISRYQIRARNEPHLTAKWYYKRQKLNWEILENGVKKKIEIKWSDIAAIKVACGGDPEILEIELHKPPHFYSEGEQRPKMHSPWNQSSDFTGGQASTYRIHYLEFGHGTQLDRKMEPLFALDPRLRERPFPSLESPSFVGYIPGAPRAPPPLINPQLLQPHQIPPDHSSVPIISSSSNLVDSISTGQQSANRLLPSLEDSQVSDYSEPQLSSLSPRSETKLDLELRIGHLPPSETKLDLELRLGTPADNATASSDDPDNTRHVREGYHHDNHPNMMMASDHPSCTRADMDIAHHALKRNNQAIVNQVDMGRHSGLGPSTNPHRDVVLALPSSSSYYPMTNDHARHRPDDEQYNNRNEEQLVMTTSDEPRTNDVNAHDGHDGPIDAEIVSNPHQKGSSSSSAHGESESGHK